MFCGDGSVAAKQASKQREGAASDGSHDLLRKCAGNGTFLIALGFTPPRLRTRASASDSAPVAPIHSTPPTNNAISLGQGHSFTTPSPTPLSVSPVLVNATRFPQPSQESAQLQIPPPSPVNAPRSHSLTHSLTHPLSLNEKFPVPPLSSIRVSKRFAMDQVLDHIETPPAAVAVSSNDESLNSDATQEDAMEGPPASDEGFVHIGSSQKGEAMKALSSIIKSEQEQSNIDGDWVALSSPALKVHALEESTPPSESSTESSVHAEAAAPEPAKPRIISYDHVKTTSTDPAQDVDPTKRESYLSEAEFQVLFGMSKSQFYALPKWKQAQRKLNLDLF